MSKQDNKKNTEYETRKAVIIGDTFNRLLHPLSIDIPELLIPLCGIPIIEYMIDNLTSSNIKEIIICAKNNANLLQDYVRKYHKKKPIKFVISEEFNSVGDCLRKINTENLISEDFILIRGLSISNLDFEAVFNYHLRKKKEEKNSLMLTTLVKEYKNTSAIKTDYDDNIIIYNPQTNKIYQYESTFQKSNVVFNDNITFKQKETEEELIPYRIRTDFYEASIDICSPEILNVFTENFDFHSIRDDLFKNGVITDNFYLYEISRDQFLGLIRNPESLLKVSFEIVNRWAYPVVIEDIVTAPKLNINLKAIDFSIYNDKQNKEENYAKAKLISSVVLGKNCVVGEGTVLKSTMLDHDVTIGKNCSLENCIVLSGSIIGNNAKIKNSIISLDTEIMDNVEVTNSMIGKKVSQEDNATGERIFFSIDGDENEHVLERYNKELFYKNLEDKEVPLISTKGIFGEEEQEEDDNEESSSDEESGEEEENEEEEEDYENDLENVIVNGLSKSASVDDMMKEIGSLKSAFWEKTYAETVKACLKPIISNFLNGENFSSSRIVPLKELLINWKGLFKRMVPTEKEEVQLISVLEQLCLDINEISEGFHIIVQLLNSNELEVIRDKAIKVWYEKEVSEYPTSEGLISIPEGTHVINKERMIKYIEANINV